MTITKLKPWWRRWYVAWPTGLLVAAVVTPWMVFRIAIASEPPPLPPSGDRVDTAVSALRSDHFYVSPEMGYLITPEQRSEIAQVLRSARVPAYLVLWNAKGDQGFYLEHDALDQIMAGVGVDGHYAIVNQDQRDTGAALGMSSEYVDSDVLQQRLGPGLLAYAKAMAALPETPEPKQDYWGGPGGGIAAGLLFVGFGFPALLGIVAGIGVMIRRNR